MNNETSNLQEEISLEIKKIIDDVENLDNLDFDVDMYAAIIDEKVIV